MIDHDEIDRLNIRQATLKAMHGAVSNLQLRSGHDIDMVLIDGQDTPVDLTIDSETIVHGDDLSLSIAAASVVAKVSHKKNDRHQCVRSRQCVIGSWNRTMRSILSIALPRIKGTEQKGIGQRLRNTVPVQYTEKRSRCDLPRFKRISDDARFESVTEE